ncbi:PD-(D/E)XK nuclease family protein [Lactiplantibacillus pentosus]|uniref:PDDEXK-like family protein n=1 Tax=Lactiplantibacillus pentosus TaxID=1589 RepID=UPI001C1F44AA|nr:PD-(D/E)XK nuclease family protein [Lactiplantibacillus pentosus]MBU7502390.1 PD-(D/E)XK nuclease family protein [Lactiplantibacillus pentosus]MDY1545378.1 PD-(D/E)XK nuclease family protein [Lactiplantibacillus pentosus]
MVKQSDIDNLISELQSISSKVAEFNNNDQNLFHIISMDHMEIKHSNLLGWLLDVNGSHELKDAFLKNLMLQIIPIYNRNCNKVDTKPLPSSVSENNWLDSAVLREYKNIDILFQDNTNNLNLIIENKIYSSEHSNQLERYEKIVNFEYPDETNTNIFIYLTLYGEEARSKKWITLTYQNVISALYKTIYSVSNLNAKTTIILFDYIYLLKELIGMDDDEKQKIALQFGINTRMRLNLLRTTVSSQKRRSCQSLKGCAIPKQMKTASCSMKNIVTLFIFGSKLVR